MSFLKWPPIKQRLKKYNALDEGWLRQIIIKEGEEAAVNDPIAILTAEKNESLEGYKPEGIAPQLEPEQKGEISPSSPDKEEQPKKAEEKKKAASYAQPQFIPEPPLEASEFEYPTEKLKRNASLLLLWQRNWPVKRGWTSLPSRGRNPINVL